MTANEVIRERHRIADILHGGLAQQLAVMALRVGDLEAQLRASGDRNLAEVLRIGEVLEGSTTDLRSLITALSQGQEPGSS